MIYCVITFFNQVSFLEIVWYKSYVLLKNEMGIFVFHEIYGENYYFTEDGEKNLQDQD